MCVAGGVLQKGYEKKNKGLKVTKSQPWGHVLASLYIPASQSIKH